MTRSRYVKAPVPPPELQPLYEAVLKVLAGEWTVTQAAEALGLSRLRFQTRMHRGLNGLLEALADQPQGRKAVPESEKLLQQQVAALQRENQRLARQASSTVRMMGLATEWMKKGLQSSGRQSGATAESPPASDSDDDNGVTARLAQVHAMKAAGVPTPLAAAAVGISAPTARRWSRRARCNEPLLQKRGPVARTSSPPAAARQKALEVLTALHGHVGAAPLARASGLSRRCAARVKAEAKTEAECARRAATTRVELQPCVLRGVDGVMLGRRPVLIAADGAVGFRTSAVPAAHYDEAAVAAVLAADFERHGAPYVVRLDRARCHTAPKVREVLAHHQVLVLQGPPHCPQYYGQLERQNREHRAWLDASEWLSFEQLRQMCESMRQAFNELVPRRKLSWQTAGAVWRSALQPKIDRWELKDEVNERRKRLAGDEAVRGGHPGMAERLAIEAALTHRGLLKLTKGGWC